MNFLSFLLEQEEVGAGLPPRMKNAVARTWGKKYLSKVPPAKTKHIPDAKIELTDGEKKLVLKHAFEMLGKAKASGDIWNDLSQFTHKVLDKPEFDTWFNESVIDPADKMDWFDLWLSDLLLLSSNMLYNISVGRTKETGHLELSKNQKVNFNKWYQSYQKVTGETAENALLKIIPAIKSVLVDSDIDLDLLSPERKMYLYVSGKPSDILAMSLHKLSESCQNLYSSGEYKRHLLSNVFDANMKVAYLVYDSPFIDSAGDEHPFTAVARTILRDLDPESQEGLLYAEKSYPDRLTSLFHEILQKYGYELQPYSNIRHMPYGIEDFDLGELPDPYMDSLYTVRTFRKLRELSNNDLMGFLEKASINGKATVYDYLVSSGYPETRQFSREEFTKIYFLVPQLFIDINDSTAKIVSEIEGGKVLDINNVDLNGVRKFISKKPDFLLRVPHFHYGLIGEDLIVSTVNKLLMGDGEKSYDVGVRLLSDPKIGDLIPSEMWEDLIATYPGTYLGLLPTKRYDILFSKEIQQSIFNKTMSNLKAGKEGPFLAGTLISNITQFIEAQKGLRTSRYRFLDSDAGEVPSEILKHVSPKLIKLAAIENPTAIPMIVPKEMLDRAMVFKFFGTQKLRMVGTYQSIPPYFRQLVIDKGFLPDVLRINPSLVNYFGEEGVGALMSTPLALNKLIETRHGMEDDPYGRGYSTYLRHLDSVILKELTERIIKTNDVDLMAKFIASSDNGKLFSRSFEYNEANRLMLGFPKEAWIKAAELSPDVMNTIQIYLIAEPSTKKGLFTPKEFKNLVLYFAKKSPEYFDRVRYDLQKLLSPKEFAKIEAASRLYSRRKYLKKNLEYMRRSNQWGNKPDVD